MPKLWGDNYYNGKTKKFTKDANENDDGKTLTRAFA